jgi:hypothetical protein
MKEEWTEADDAIEEVREVRRRISARFDDDPKKMIEHYVERDRKYTGPKLTPADRGKPGKSAA